MSAISEVDVKDMAEDQQLELFPKDSVDDVLNERGKRYGTFEGHANICQFYKSATIAFLQERAKYLANDQAEALDMIFHKIARIINGDPNYSDSWVDIAGYAKLVADRLEGRVR